ncbi:MAG: hypothetical protein HY801_16450, partial [Candidatus Lindowbacteria bacterium]|nr:hypothetical protein [Candidatus Lindowbacteria bacterium]
MTKNYILGRGENLVRRIEPPKIDPQKAHPYKVREARNRLLPKLRETAKVLNQLPEDACPRGQTVASIVMHPAYLAKSYYPHEFFRDAKLRVLGSRAVSLTPEKIATQGEPKPSITAEFFVASSRKNFAELPAFVNQLDLRSEAAEQLRQFEDVHEFGAESKLRNIPRAADYPWLEIVLHA